MTAPKLASGLTLRSCAPEDFDALFEIDQACYEPEIAYSRRELRNYLRFPGADCVVAQIGSAIVGFCITASRAGAGYIITIDVLDQYRRAGVGTALLNEVEARMASSGVGEVRLETATDNHSAIAFWKRHGYLTVRVWKHYYRNGRDAYSMTKRIRPFHAPRS
jgi:ribosomal protein S18 acetylase RimI-like enzyme